MNMSESSIHPSDLKMKKNIKVKESSVTFTDSTEEHGRTSIL